MKYTDIKSIPIILSAAIASLALTACGPSDDSARSGSGADSGSASSASANANADQTVEITANDQMKFGVESFEVEAGQTIEIVLKNIGSMPKMSMGHNVVVLKEGVDETAFVEAAMAAAANDYIPADREGEVIAHTKMLGGGEEDSVTFTAPTKPGEYTFICSFPGHYQVGMKGTMIVR